MSANSKIEWCTDTWNPVIGCSIASAGCANCYAMRMAARIEKMTPGSHYAGLTKPSKAGPVWSGKIALAPEHVLTAPLRRRRPRKIFVNSMGDLFHKDVPDEWIDSIFAVMALCPQHTFQIPTKRTPRMRSYFADASVRERVAGHIMMLAKGPVPTVYSGALTGIPDRVYPWPLPNVWLGASIEDQKRANERRKHLQALSAMGWTTFVSYEPALGPVDCTGWEWLSWLISGGESGPGARPSHPDWHRAARDFCQANGIPYFFKQHGEWIGVPDLRRLPGGQGPGFGAFDHLPFDHEHEAVRIGKRRAGRLLDGREWNEFPCAKGGV